MDKFKELGGDKRREALPNLSAEQHKDIELLPQCTSPRSNITFDARTEDEEDVQEGDVINLVVTVERRHLAEDPDWVDSDDEDDEPDESIFDEQLKGLEEGTEEYDTKKDKLMDAWRDSLLRACEEEARAREGAQPAERRARLRGRSAEGAGAGPCALLPLRAHGAMDDHAGRPEDAAAGGLPEADAELAL